jgi:hypothetical protein
MRGPDGRDREQPWSPMLLAGQKARTSGAIDFGWVSGLRTPGAAASSIPTPYFRIHLEG